MSKKVQQAPVDEVATFLYYLHVSYRKKGGKPWEDLKKWKREQFINMAKDLLSNYSVGPPLTVAATNNRNEYI